jgi:phage tail tube protein FII
MPAQTIDEVINQLQAIVTDAIATNNRAGYFAALYLKVTTRVKEGIEAGEFEDGARMEMFDVTFANRYIEAHRQWVNKQQPSASWRLAFEMLEKPRVLVLQHLMLGMNAHINLDLGIAVVELSKSQNKPLEVIHKDFNSISIPFYRP